DAPAASGAPSPAVAVPTDPAPPSAAASGPASPTVPDKVAPPTPRVPLRRAIAVKGAILMGQDGVYVQYRKRCVECGYEDPCRSSMQIGQGLTRVYFFCRKCKKSRDVQIQGLMQ